MPNLDPWVNQNNNYEDMTTKTINKFENQIILIAYYLDAFIPMIKEALDDFDKKPNTGI